MTLRDHLRAIYDSHGTLTPALVVEEARPKGHPLHDRFEWNDKIAGEKYRIIQARDLIQEVTVARESDDSPAIRYYHSIQRDDGCVYEPVDQVVQDELLTKIVLRTMKREWENLKRRYGHFRKFVEMVRKDTEAA